MVPPSVKHFVRCWPISVAWIVVCVAVGVVFQWL